MELVHRKSINNIDYLMFIKYAACPVGNNG